MTPSRTVSRIARPGLIALLLAVAVGLACWRWWPRAETPPVDMAQQEESPEEPPRASNPGYIGPDGCAACHAARVAGFRQTRHFRACWSASAGPMPVGFTTRDQPFASRNPGVRFQSQLVRGEYLQTVFRASAEGEEKLPSRIDLVYGAGGRADEVYFTWRGNHLFELPIAWLHTHSTWGEQPYNPDARGDFTRTTTVRCIECHNTWLEHIPGTENEYRKGDAILGVTCENCHGPGREHASHHQKHPDLRHGQAITHPGRLSRERQVDVCAQCHSNATVRRGPAFSYRPGDPLDAHFRTLADMGVENDHVADQTRSMRKSRCFTKSDTLTCTTCHNPHRPMEVEKVDRACFKCHQADHCREQPRIPLAVRERCVDCHMPRYNRVAVKFHTTDDQYVFPMRPRDHRIAVFPVARQEVLLEWYRSQSDETSRQKVTELTAALVTHWLAECDRERDAHRLFASIGAAREAVRIMDTPMTRAALQQAIARQARLDAALHAGMRGLTGRKFTEGIDALESALRIKPTLAMAHGKLGTLYELVGQHDKAGSHWRAVSKHDPDDPYGENMLGWRAYLTDQPERAIEHYRKADEVLPFTVEINYRWGLALLQLQKWTEALERFKQAMRVDPRHAGSHQGASHAVRKLGRVQDGVRLARRAVQLTQEDNADVLLSLAEAYADAHRNADAVDAATKALTVARRNAPAQLPHIAQRLEAFRAQTAR